MTSNPFKSLLGAAVLILVGWQGFCIIAQQLDLEETREKLKELEEDNKELEEDNKELVAKKRDDTQWLISLQASNSTANARIHQLKKQLLDAGLQPAEKPTGIAAFMSIMMGRDDVKEVEVNVKPTREEESEFFFPDTMPEQDPML